MAIWHTKQFMTDCNALIIYILLFHAEPQFLGEGAKPGISSFTRECIGGGGGAAFVEKSVQLN